MAFSLANVVDSFVASNFIGGDALAAVKMASPIFTLTIILGAILGFIVAMLAQIMPETLAMVMGADDELISGAGIYAFVEEKQNGRRNKE